MRPCRGRPAEALRHHALAHCGELGVMYAVGDRGSLSWRYFGLVVPQGGVYVSVTRGHSTTLDGHAHGSKSTIPPPWLQVPELAVRANDNPASIPNPSLRTSTDDSSISFLLIHSSLLRTDVPLPTTKDEDRTNGIKHPCPRLKHRTANLIWFPCDRIRIPAQVAPA